LDSVNWTTKRYTHSGGLFCLESWGSREGVCAL